MATNTFPTQLQFSIHVHLVPCLLSELSLKSLLFISSTNVLLPFVKKKIKTRSFARHFCSDQSIGSCASVVIRQDQEPITRGVSNLHELVSRRFYRPIFFLQRF